MPDFAFMPSPDVMAITNALLDICERRNSSSPGAGEGKGLCRTIRCDVQAMTLPGYHSQVDPHPRQVAHEQLEALEQGGYVRLAWLLGQEKHLLADMRPLIAHMLARGVKLEQEAVPAAGDQ